MDNRDDISLFVDQEINAREALWKFKVSPELKELICNKLVEKSEGM